MQLLDRTANRVTAARGCAAADVIYSDHADRAVFAAIDPIGRYVVVKGDRDTQRLNREVDGLGCVDWIADHGRRSVETRGRLIDLIESIDTLAARTS